jgi:hypothetical protein
MNQRLRIKRLERLSTDQRPVCAHAFTLFVDGVLVQDDPPCSCGGERITLVAAFESESSFHETSTVHDGTAAVARAKSI